MKKHLAFLVYVKIKKLNRIKINKNVFSQNGALQWIILHKIPLQEKPRIRKKLLERARRKYFFVDIVNIMLKGTNKDIKCRLLN